MIEVVHVLQPHMHSLQFTKDEFLQFTTLEAGAQAPQTDGEVCSALLNGDIFIPDTPTADRKNPQLTKDRHIQYANKICNLACHRLCKERDLLLNSLSDIE